MVINHNMSALFAQRSQGIQDLNAQKSMEKLSSGLKINRAGDDASGLAVSEKMRAQIRGLNQASTNAQNGISFIQTTEGYLQETTDIIQRIRELAVQSSNGIYSSEDRMQIQVEVSSLIAEVDRIASAAQFNGMNMLTGRFARPTGENAVTGSMWFHIGANMDQRTQVFIGTMSATALGLRNIGDESIMTLETPDEANRAIGTLDEALMKINKQRADLGAYQNRLLNHASAIQTWLLKWLSSQKTRYSARLVQRCWLKLISQARTFLACSASFTIRPEKISGHEKTVRFSERFFFLTRFK